MNKLLVGTLVLSGLTNVALLSDIDKMEKKTDEVINTLNRAHLIATLYVLKENQKPNIVKFKEDKHMKNIGSKLSNRTKVIGGMTILLGIGTVVSFVKDSKEINAIETDIDVVEMAPEAAEEIVESVNGVTDTVSEIAEF